MTDKQERRAWALIITITMSTLVANRIFPEDRKVPVPGGVLANTGGIQFVSDGYGPRKNPMGGSAAGSYHFGEDYACRVGTRVLAISSGTVIVCAVEDRILGRYIVIRDAYGRDVTYAHLSETWVPRGRYIEAGAVIGLSGNTGQSTGPHLHIQVSISVEAYRSMIAKESKDKGRSPE